MITRCPGRGNMEKHKEKNKIVQDRLSRTGNNRKEQEITEKGREGCFLLQGTGQKGTRQHSTTSKDLTNCSMVLLLLQDYCSCILE